MSKWVCKYCVGERGLKASDLAAWPERDAPDIQEWVANHLESEHHCPVRRGDETEEQAQERLIKQHPEVGGQNCKCPQCVEIRKRKEAAIKAGLR